MLTQHEVRMQLDTIATEVLQSPGIYYELYSRIFSQRVQQWMHSVAAGDAKLIQRVAECDPDYLSDLEIAAPLHSKPSALFNPAWDMDY
ncbi:MAG TPA: hypothetical protein VLC91_06965 [Spongiibacteraceae bacterium]|nr:hypothetical protein [Spongiibacteraceae bacterium]